jgi:hypothetical protein
MLGHGGFGNPHLLRGIGEAALVHDHREGFHFRKAIHVLVTCSIFFDGFLLVRKCGAIGEGPGPKTGNSADRS